MRRSEPPDLLHSLDRPAHPLPSLHLPDLIKEAGTSVDPTGTSVNAPPAVPSPSKAALTYTPQASRHRSNSDPLSPSFLPPAEGTSTSSLAKSAKQSSTNPFTLATKPKPPTYPSSFSTPVAGKKVAPRYQNLVDVLQGLPKARPLRSYVVPLLSREKWGKDVIVKDFLADAVQAGIVSASLCLDILRSFETESDKRLVLLCHLTDRGWKGGTARYGVDRPHRVLPNQDRPDRCCNSQTTFLPRQAHVRQAF